MTESDGETNKNARTLFFPVASRERERERERETPPDSMHGS